MTQKFKDNGRALLAGNILAAATSLTVEAGKADRFPVANTTDWGAPADWFKAVLIDASGNREVIKVGTRTLGSGVFGNVLRAQDGTTALAFSAGSVVVHAIFAQDIEDVLDGNYAGDVTVGGGITVGGRITQEGVQGRVTPVGGIIMYSGAIAAIPTGWQLCDGTNGTLAAMAAAVQARAASQSLPFLDLLSRCGSYTAMSNAGYVAPDGTHGTAKQYADEAYWLTRVLLALCN